MRNESYFANSHKIQADLQIFENGPDTQGVMPFVPLLPVADAAYNVPRSESQHDKLLSKPILIFGETATICSPSECWRT